MGATVMKKITTLFLIGALVPLLSVGAWAEGERGTKEEALAMVRRAVASIKILGPERAYAAFTGKAASFHDRDLYVIVYDATGKCLAHGSKPELVGKDLSSAKYVQDRMELMKAHTSFWQDYDFVDPLTKQIQPKSTYCEKMGDTVVCVGIYK